MTVTISQELTREEIERVVEAIAEMDVDAVAICLLHAYANSSHEERVASALRDAYPDLYVTASTEIVREFREFERATTTSVNAYVGPVMSHYLERLIERIEGGE